jgi:glycosyltransferase involved in cell wall biosynthesis
MPPRWLFDHGPRRYDDAVEPVRWCKRLYQSYVRTHDVATMARLEEVVVPSEVIGDRLQTYYGRSPTRVIYPPVDTDAYHNNGDEGYLLYLGRLAEMKRVTELVDALSETDHRLKVAGDGPLRDAVERRAGPNVEVLGYVSEERKRDLLANCTGLVFNSDREAFGIVPVEAFASGKPVAGVNEGYTAHQVIEGTNGVLFERGPENLRAAVRRLEETDWDPAAIRETAERYDTARFRERWQALLGRESDRVES